MQAGRGKSLPVSKQQFKALFLVVYGISEYFSEELWLDRIYFYN